MNVKKILTVLIFSLLFFSCKDSNGTGPINNSFYPLSQNLEWEYHSTYVTDFYDTLGNIKNSEILDLGNTIVRIEAINDTLNNFNDLIRFVSFEVGQNNNKVITWYENKNDGLYSIASKNAGASQVVIPKIINRRKYLTIDNLKQFNLFLNFNFNINKTSDSSIFFWTPPRKVLGYPLEIGNTWNELQIPSKRDRVVEAIVNINVQGDNYTVYKIGAIWQDFNIVFNDYISTKYGLIMREIFVDSSVISNAEYPDSIRFAKVTSLSKLVRKNF